MLCSISKFLNLSINFFICKIIPPIYLKRLHENGFIKFYITWSARRQHLNLILFKVPLLIITLTNSHSFHNAFSIQYMPWNWLQCCTNIFLPYDRFYLQPFFSLIFLTSSNSEKAQSKLTSLGSLQAFKNSIPLYSMNLIKVCVLFLKHTPLNSHLSDLIRRMLFRLKSEE